MVENRALVIGGGSEGLLGALILTAQSCPEVPRAETSPMRRQTADLRASLAALHRGALGRLDWLEQRPLAEGAGAFAELDAGRTAAAKIVLRP